MRSSPERLIRFEKVKQATLAFTYKESVEKEGDKKILEVFRVPIFAFEVSWYMWVQTVDGGLQVTVTGVANGQI